MRCIVPLVTFTGPMLYGIGLARYAIDIWQNTVNYGYSIMKLYSPPKEYLE